MAECRKEAEAEPAAKEPSRRKMMMFRLEGNFSGTATSQSRVLADGPPVLRGTPRYRRYLQVDLTSCYFLSGYGTLYTFCCCQAGFTLTWARRLDVDFWLRMSGGTVQELRKGLIIFEAAAEHQDKILGNDDGGSQPKMEGKGDQCYLSGTLAVARCSNKVQGL